MSSTLVSAPLSGGRFSAEAVRSQHSTFLGTACHEVFESLPSVILAVNTCRQLVFANAAATKFLGSSTREAILGKQLGDVLRCINAQESLEGCGGSKACQNCMALQAIHSALDGAVAEAQCKFLRRDKDALEAFDLQVRATPFVTEDQAFVVLALTDVTDQQRRRGMEQIFFHDVLNLAGGILGLSDVLAANCTCGHEGELAVLNAASKTLVDEIVAQRDLLAAETNALQPSFGLVNVKELLGRLKGLYSAIPLAKHQEIRIVQTSPELSLVTDGRLAARVLGNMVKNALEAGRSGDCVTLCAKDEGNTVRFEVHNSAVIPAHVQENLFHRRFSTKGEFRGYGTYSMLLLTERSLHGSVGFSSSEGKGTTFFVRLPKRLERA